MPKVRLLLALAIALLSGCETVNDAFVRKWLMDSGLSRRVNSQIREGLERREEAPPRVHPNIAPPPFMDQG